MATLDVLFVTRKWAPAVGGMETWSRRLSETLCELTGVAVDVVALPGRTNGHPPGWIALLAFPFRVARHYLLRPKVPDVLHLGDMALWPLGLLVWLRRKRPRLVLTSHGTDVSYPRRGGVKGRAYGAYLKLGAKLLQRAVVTTNSPATANATHEHGWKNTAIIPLATDVAGHAGEQLPGPHLLFVGRLIRLKGCRWFIENVLPLLPAGTELHVAGTLIDPAESAALAADRVRYLGVLDGAALAEAYRGAQCVVVPNIEPPTGEFEGFGLVAIEAAAAGGVVLASDCGGLPAAVCQGETGFLVEPENAKAWAAAISTIGSWSRSERDSFVEKSMARINTQFRWPSVAQATLAIYRSTNEIALH